MSFLLSLLKNPFAFSVGVLIALPPLLFSGAVPSILPPLLLIYLGILFGIRFFATKQLLITPVDLSLWLILLLIPLNLWATPDKVVTLDRAYALVAHIAIFFTIAQLKDKRWLRWSEWLLLLGVVGLSVALFFLTDFKQGKFDFLSREIFALLPAGFNTPWNTRLNPNLTSGVLVLFWVPTCVFILYGRSIAQRLLAFIGISLLTLVLLLAQTRGAILGAGVATGICVLVVFRPKYARPLIFAGLIGAALLLLRYDLLVDNLTGNLDTLGDTITATGRQQLWNRAIFAIEDFPITGVGLGMTESAIRILYPPFTISPLTSFTHVHNTYLQIGVELGIVGMIAFLAFLFGILVLLSQQVTQRANANWQLSLGLLGSMLAFMLHGIVDAVIYFPRAALIIWAVFGYMVAVATSSEA